MSVLDQLFDTMEAALDQATKEAQNIIKRIGQIRLKPVEEVQEQAKNMGGVTLEEAVKALNELLKYMYGNGVYKAPKYERKKQRLKINR